MTEPRQIDDPIDTLLRYGGTVRSVNAFARLGVLTTEHLAAILSDYYTAQEQRRVSLLWKNLDPRGIGPATIDNMRDALASYRNGDSPSPGPQSPAEVDWSKPLCARNKPQGASPHELRILDGAGISIVATRLAHGLPCTLRGGCGENRAEQYRLPTTGLNAPGAEAPVIELLWCPRDGQISARLVDANEQERVWGWNHTTTC